MATSDAEFMDVDDDDNVTEVVDLSPERSVAGSKEKHAVVAEMLKSLNDGMFLLIYRANGWTVQLGRSASRARRTWLAYVYIICRKLRFIPSPTVSPDPCDALLVYGVETFSSFDVKTLVEPVEVRVDFHDDNKWCIIYFPSEAETFRALIELTQPLEIVSSNGKSKSLTTSEEAVKMQASELPVGINDVGPWRIFKSVLLKRQCRFLLTRFATASERRLLGSQCEDVLKIDNADDDEMPVDNKLSPVKKSRTAEKIIHDTRSEFEIERELERRGQPSLNPARHRTESDDNFSRSTKRSIVNHPKISGGVTKKTQNDAATASLHLKHEIRSHRLLNAAVADSTPAAVTRISAADAVRGGGGKFRREPIAALIRPVDHVKSRLTRPKKISRRHKSADANDADDDEPDNDADAVDISIALTSTQIGDESADDEVSPGKSVGRKSVEDVLVVNDDSRSHARSTRMIEGGGISSKTALVGSSSTRIVEAIPPVAVEAVPAADLREEIDFKRYARQQLTAAQIRRQQEIIEQQQHYQEMAKAYKQRQTTASYDNDLF